MAGEEVFREGLGPLELGCAGGRAEAAAPGRRKHVDHARHQRRLRPDHRQVNAFTFSQGKERLRVFGVGRHVAYPGLQGRAGIARGDQHFPDTGGLRQLPRQRVLAAAAADYQHFHRASPVIESSILPIARPQ